MAKGVERKAPRAARALRQLANANVEVGRAQRAAGKVSRDNEKQLDRIRQINEELAKQDREAIENSNKKSRIQKREERQRRRRTRDLNEEADLIGTLIGLQRQHAEEIDKTTQFRLNLQEIKRKNDLLDEKERLSKQQLIDLEDKLRDRQREDSRRGEQIKQMTKDREVLRGQLGRTTAILNRHESTLSDIDKEAVARGKERNKLLEEETGIRGKATQRTEASTRARENERRAIRNQDNALLAYNHTLDESTRRHKKHGNEMNIVGRMLTDLPFVPGGKAGAIIGGGVLLTLASVAEAAVTASQSIATLPAIATAGGAAFGTLALGLTGFGQAMKDIGDPEKFAEAVQGLSPAAQQAALEIRSLVEGPLTDLKNRTQESLFAGVPEMLHNTAYTLLPPIDKLTGGLSGSMNNMFGNALGQLTSPESMKSLETIINNIVTAFQRLEPAVAPFVSAITKIVETGSGFLPGFADAITNAATSFNNFITKAQQDGSLQNFIQKGIDAAVALKDLVVEIGRRIFESFGNKSPEDFKNTIHSVADALMSIVNLIVGLANFINDLLGPIQHVAEVLGGWETLITVAAGAFAGFKLIGLEAASSLAAGFAGAGTAAGTGFATTAAAGIKGFGWAALGAFIGAELAGALINSDWLTQFEQNNPLANNPISRWMNTHIPGSNPNWNRPDAPSAPIRPMPFGPGINERPPVPPPAPRLGSPLPFGPTGGQDTTLLGGPGAGGGNYAKDWYPLQHPPPPGLPPGAPGYSPQAVPPPPPDKSGGGADKRRRELENQFANDPRFNVDPFGNIPGAPAVPPGISPQTGQPGPPQTGQPGPNGAPPIAYRQTNPYEPGSYGVYNVDPQAVSRETYDLKVAAREWGDAQKNLAVVTQLQKENLASQQDVIDAQQKRDDREQGFIEARWALNKAETGTFDKINKGTKNLQGVQQEIGAKIDDDFGISKGLPGIFENLFKVIANMAMAPVIGALTGITNVAGTAGPGTGLLGMFSEGKNMFGPTPNIFGQFTDPDTIAKYSPGLTGGLTGGPTGGPAINLGGPLTGLPDPHGAHPQVSYLAALAERFNLKLISGKNDHVDDGLNHPKGLAGDFSNGTGNTPQQAQFAQFLHDNFGDLLNEEIYSDPSVPGVGISMGQNHQFDAGTLGDHMNHIHASVSDANAAAFEQRVQAMLGGQMPMAAPGYSGSSGFSGAGSGVVPVFVTNMGGGMGGPGGGGAMPGTPASGTGAGPLPGPGQGGLTPEQWDLIASGESGKEGVPGSANWSINSGNGYSGGLQFTPSTWNSYKPADAPAQAWQATREQQIAAGNATLAAQGSGAWPAVSGRHPEWFKPPSGPPGTSATGPNATTPGGGAGPFPFGPNNAPGGESFVPGTQPFGPISNTGTNYTPAYGRMYAEGKPASSGFSLGGLASMAGGAAGMMPGMGQLAQIGIDEINRGIQAGAQLAGIGVEGLMETFLPVESELADPARGWFGRFLGAAAGVKPVAKNISGLMGGPDTKGQPGQGDQPLTPEQIAAQKAKDGQNQPGQPPPQVNVNVDNTKAPEDLQTAVGQNQEMANSMPGPR